MMIALLLRLDAGVGMKVRFSLVIGLGVVDTPGCGLVFDGMKFLRKSLLRLIFWIEAAFLKTDGFAGVDRGVGGVDVPSSMGVLSPVLLPSFCNRGSEWTSAVGVSVSFEILFFSVSYTIRFSYIQVVYLCC
jgi:hypothetical protein